MKVKIIVRQVNYPTFQLRNPSVFLFFLLQCRLSVLFVLVITLIFNGSVNSKVSDYALIIK